MAKDSKLWELFKEFLPEILSIGAFKAIVSGKEKPTSPEKPTEEQPKIRAGGLFNLSEEEMWILALNEIKDEKKKGALQSFLASLDSHQADRFKNLVGHLYNAVEKDGEGKITKRGSTEFLEYFSGLTPKKQRKFCEQLGGILESDIQRDLKEARAWFASHEEEIRKILAKIHSSPWTKYHGPIGELLEMLRKLWSRIKNRKCKGAEAPQGE